MKSKSEAMTAPANIFVFGVWPLTTKFLPAPALDLELRVKSM